MNNFIAQTLGIFAFLIFISSVQFKNKKHILLAQLSANILYGILYLFLNIPTTAYMNFISVLRCILFYKYDNKKVPLWCLIFLLTIIGITSIFTFDGYLSLIPIIITILYTTSTWQNNTKFIRIVFTICSVFWIYYNLSVKAITALFGNIFELVSGIISLIRYRKKRKH